MLTIAVEYWAAIDIIIAEKKLMLWKYEMDDEDWEIVKDLIQVLKVNFFLSRINDSLLIIHFRYTRIPRSSSLRTMPQQLHKSSQLWIELTQ
jgi:hypothetical protein